MGKERVIDILRETMTVKEIASDVGVSVRCVNLWLSGKRNPDRINLNQLKGLAKERIGGKIEDREKIKAAEKASEKIDGSDTTRGVSEPVKKDQELVTVKKGWYEGLILDVRKLEYTSIVVGKWTIGQRILQDFEKFGKPKYGNKTVDGLAKDLQVSKREIYRCIDFARKCHDVTQLTGWTWRLVCNDYLPEPKIGDKRSESKKDKEEKGEGKMFDFEEEMRGLAKKTLLCLVKSYPTKTRLVGEKCKVSCDRKPLCLQIVEILQKSPILKKEVEELERRRKDNEKNSHNDS